MRKPTELSRYAGCRMFPPFSEDEAYEECLRIIEGIEAGRIRIKQLTTESAERRGQGIMIGALICRGPDGKRIVLRTVSGIGKELVFEDDDCGIFVRPIVSAEKISAALTKNDARIHELTGIINHLKRARNASGSKVSVQSEEEKHCSKERALLTKESLLAVYDLYSFACADGKKRRLLEICSGKLPPTGTGDCCAPKLLDFAFSRSLVPLSMAEVFYGADTKTRISGRIYPPCDERCALLLPALLGLRIIYRDSLIIVVDKQSGLLSVPGRGPEKQDCIVSRVKRLFPECIAQPAVHRLDMETSGLMVLAFTAEAHRNLNRQFEDRLVEKEYVALVDGAISCADGTAELFFRVDVDNRPHQIWDEKHGKRAVTEWHKIREEQYTSSDGRRRLVTRVQFIPHTGRTHQLRLMAADSHGFGKPIVGDTLYGECAPGEHLMLHARTLRFFHPVTGEKMQFVCEPEF